MEVIKQRVIQELVPGKQITLAHIIANPDTSLYKSLSPLENGEIGQAIGIMTITPPETVIIIADIAVKSAGVQLLSVSMENGSLVVTGTVSEVEAATNAILDYVGKKLGFEVCSLTKT